LALAYPDYQYGGIITGYTRSNVIELIVSAYFWFPASDTVHRTCFISTVHM